ncbi:MAG: hypothetical protein AAF170_17345 [Bacteroidota bacterium]
MRRLLIVVIALVGTSCSGANSSDAGLTGTYTSDHEIRVFNGDEFVPETATDRLALIERADSLDVSLVLLFDNYHICEMHTRMSREGTGWVSILEPEFADETTCTLQLEVGAEVLSLRDETGSCRRTYCGARGVIDGATFDRSTRAPDTSWRDDLR